MAPDKNTDPESAGRPHEWVHFALGRRCAACGITLTTDDPEPPTACAAAVRSEAHEAERPQQTPA